jgi:geranylgeranyl diphosphate synthase type I
MNIELGTALSPQALKAKETIKAFINQFEPYFKKKLDEEYLHAQSFYNEHSADATDFYNQIAIRGGKRVRAALSYYVYKMLGGKNEQAALDLARAIEMMHAFLLVLDDYTDKSMTRRGGPTAHEIAQNYFMNPEFVRNDPYHFGCAVSLTAGVLQNYRCQEIIMSLPIEPNLIIEICKNFNSKLAITGYGQISDIINSLSKNVSEEDVLHMLEWKTSNYTFSNPMQAGAIMAGALHRDLALIDQYAIPVGIAFQIHDDVIGMFGNAEYTGKSDKDDLMEGKMTLLIQHALTHGNTNDIDLINKHLGNRNVTDDEHAMIKETLVATGSYDYAENIAKKLVEKAKSALKNAPESWSAQGIEFLDGVADYVIQRAH